MNRKKEKIFAKTKILCTLGPSSSKAEDIKKLLNAGMDGVRLNFSHGDYKFFESLFEEIHKAEVETSSPLAVLIDLQGPKIRIGNLLEPFYEIKTGEKIEITIDDIQGTKELVSTSYKQLINDAHTGELILIDDGLIRLKVAEIKERSVVCEILNGGILKPKKGMNMPGMNLSTPSITEKDFRDLEFALSKRVDFIALSFVRKADDVRLLKKWLAERRQNVPVIAKIEKKEAVDCFEEILEAADGIMVARGDLGVEMYPCEVPVMQKKIINSCNAAGKLVITATQMLESMINNPIPTRAEASDVANAVWDGTDVVMLSGETSVGKFPVDTVFTMNSIVKYAEVNGSFGHNIIYKVPENLEENLFDSVSRGIVIMSEQINASAVVVFTHQGRAPKILSKYRPKAKIIAISDEDKVVNNLRLKWGVEAVLAHDIHKNDVAIEEAKKVLLERELVSAGDVVIFTTGAPISDKSRTNWIRLEVI
jgi:pyruvate kinase